MIKLILAVVILCAAVFIGPRLADSQGFIHIATNNYIVETSITTATIIAIVAFVILHILVNLLKGFFGIPTNTARFFNKRRGIKRIRLQSEADLAYEEGAYERALTIIKKIDDKEDLPLGCLYLGAKSAFKLKKYDECRKYIELSEKHPKGTKAASNLLRAKLNLEIGNTKAALESLAKISDNSMQKAITELKTEAYLKDNNYEQLSLLLPTIRKLKIKSEEEQNKISALCAKAKASQAKDKEELLSIINTFNKGEKKDPEFMTPVINRMMELGDTEHASKYAVELLRHTSSKTLLNSIAKWDKAMPEVLHELQRLLEGSLDKPNVPLLKALANLEIKAEKYEEAQTHLDKILEKNQSSDIYYIAAQLNEKKQNFPEASKFFALAFKAQ